MGAFAVGYLAAVNAAAFLLYGLDKWKARHSRWRIPERTLLGAALAGGSAGAWLGMKVFHHKTRHRRFTVGVPVILFAQAAAALALYRFL